MNVFILKICEYEYGDNTLQQAIKERKIEFNEEDCLQLFVQIVCGVLYIHKKKIIHRNIKPSNIVVTKQNIVKISDFGVSCVMDISSNSHTNIGTPTICLRKCVQEKGTTPRLTCGRVVAFCLRCVLPECRFKRLTTPHL